MNHVLVEHSFVTTLDAPAATRAAADFLALKGFTTRHPAAPLDPNHLVMHRGPDRPTRKALPYDLPQDLRLEYDRGRVTLAASVLPYRDRPLPVHADLVLSLAQSLERLLAHRLPPDQAIAPFALIEQRITDQDILDRRGRRKYLITLACIGLAAVALLITLLVTLKP